jgi:hypothetical protein
VVFGELGNFPLLGVNLGQCAGGLGFGWGFYWVEVGFKPPCRWVGLLVGFLLGGGGF